MDLHPFQFAFQSQLAQSSNNAMFDTATQHAAAQKERFDVQRTLSLLKYNNASESVIAKAIADRDREYL